MEKHTDIQGVLRRPRRIAAGVGIALAVLLSSTGVFVGRAPMAKGVIAPGQVVVLSNRKVVQHHAGGTVAGIEVAEGEHVHAGQLLLHIEDLQATRQLGQFLKERDSLLARAGFLRAQQQGQRTINYHQDLTERKETPRVARLIEDHDRALDALWKRVDGQVRIHRENVAAMRERIPGLTAQKKALSDERALLKEDMEKQVQLLELQLADEERRKFLQREIVRFGGQIAGIDTEINDAESQMRLEERRLSQLLLDMESEASSSIASIQSEIDKIDDQIAIQKDIHERTQVKAPQQGIVFNLQVHTIGGVIGPGQPLMEIVPGDDLVVETRINPADIDNVQLGQKGSIRFSAFRQGATPEIDGTVIELSADAILAEGQLPFYVVRIAPDEGQIERLGNFTIVPGMPAEVLFEGDERTAFDYFSGSLSDIWWKAMTEG